jgi:hypothetical protein
MTHHLIFQHNNYVVGYDEHLEDRKLRDWAKQEYWTIETGTQNPRILCPTQGFLLDGVASMNKEVRSHGNHRRSQKQELPKHI